MGTESDDAARLELLLVDIRDAFAKEGEAPAIASADLVKTLVALDGRPWAEMGKAGKPMTQKMLARMLKSLGIVTDKVGPENARLAGYKLWQFEEAFLRYLPSEGVSPGQNAANTGNGGERGLSSRRIHELANWYSDRAYWHFSPNALAAGMLDAELRAILRKEVFPEHVEIEFERVMKAVPR